MLTFIKRILRKRLIAELYPFTSTELLWPTLIARIGRTSSLRIADVGAHTGSFVEHAMSFAAVSGAVFIEPQPMRVRTLREKFDPFGFTTVEAAVSHSTGHSTFNVLKWDQSSSLRLPKPEVAGIGRRYDFDIESVISVRTDTLDNLMDAFIDGGRIDILKLDTQGSEVDAIHGGARTLPIVDFLVCELPLKVTYESASDISQISRSLEHRGFVLVELFPNTRGLNDELIECDAVFMNSRRRY